MQTKICSKCKQEKPVNQFYRDNNRPDGLNYWCIDCWKEKGKRYRQNNSEKIKANYQAHKKQKSEYNKFYRLMNRERLNQKSKEYYRNNKERIREYKRKNREYINQYARNKRKIDIKSNLVNRISRAIRFTLKDGKKGEHWEDLVGYTCNDLIKHLQKTMPIGYTWDDFLEGKLHIDHIIPVSVFNFTKPEHTDFKRCWALENLQLLPAKENISKQNKLYKPFQPALKV